MNVRAAPRGAGPVGSRRPVLPRRSRASAPHAIEPGLPSASQTFSHGLPRPRGVPLAPRTAAPTPETAPVTAPETACDAAPMPEAAPLAACDTWPPMCDAAPPTPLAAPVTAPLTRFPALAIGLGIEPCEISPRYILAEIYRDTHREKRIGRMMRPRCAPRSADLARGRFVDTGGLRRDQRVLRLEK